MQHLNIGDAAAAAGVTPKMVRHYESLGLIPEAARTEAGYRLYGEREIAMLRFIRQARSLGFSMPQIEELMSLWRDPARQSHAVKQVAERHLHELAQRQRELDQMRATLEQMVARCRGDHGAQCVILDQLASLGSPQTVRAIPTRGALKEVRPGEKRPWAQARKSEDHKPASAVLALSAWAQTFPRSAAD